MTAALLALVGALIGILTGAHAPLASAVDEADVRIGLDDETAVVLCIVEPDGRARCHHREGVVAGAVDGAAPGICGLADRPLDSPCGRARECAFHRVAVPAELFGLLVLETRRPLFGVPRHTLIDAAVVSRAPPSSRASSAPELVGGLQTLARCMAPSERGQIEIQPPLRLEACQDHPCRLRRSTVQVAVLPHVRVNNP